MPKSLKSKDTDLEKSFQELERITEDLQGGKLDLETSLQKFERGLSLAESLKKRLGEIENRIETVRLKFQKSQAKQSDDEG